MTLVKDILAGRYGPGTPVAEVADVHSMDPGRHYGRFVTLCFPSQYVEVVTVDGRLVRAETHERYVLFQSLTPDEETERCQAFDTVVAEVRQMNRSQKALRGLVGFGAVADPRLRQDPFAPPGK